MLDFIQNNNAVFPALNQCVGTNKQKLIYLDSAATTFKPKSIIDKVSDFYSHHGGAAGRGTNSLAFYSSEIVENTRQNVLGFCFSNEDLGVKPNYECIFTNGATDSLNMLALGIDFAWSKFVKNNSETRQNIVLSYAEHHANILPWQELAKRRNLELRYLNLTESGTIDVDNISHIVDNNTLLISLTHCSNVTGQITNIKQFMKNLSNLNDSIQKKYPQNYVRPLVFLDSSQAIAHIPLEIDKFAYQNASIDAVCFSAHKIYGLNGVGALIATKKLLNLLSVSRFGGGIVELVTPDSATYLQIPQKFESGSIDVGAIVSLNEAIEFIKSLGWDNINKHEQLLISRLALGFSQLANKQPIKLLGNKPNDFATEKQIALVSFALEGIHPHDLGQFLDERGVVVRTGHHCAQLIHQKFGIPSSTRISCGIYTTIADLDIFFEALDDAITFFKH